MTVNDPRDGSKKIVQGKDGAIIVEQVGKLWTRWRRFSGLVKVWLGVTNQIECSVKPGPKPGMYTYQLLLRSRKRRHSLMRWSGQKDSFMEAAQELYQRLVDAANDGHILHRSFPPPNLYFAAMAESERQINDSQNH